jgi:nucleotide-binding universal stress UspA family protein
VTPGTPQEVREVVVGVDGSDASRRALSWALREARLHAVTAAPCPVLVVRRRGAVG